MRKTLAIILAIMLVLVLAACGSNSGKAQTNPPAATTDGTQAPDDAAKGNETTQPSAPDANVTEPAAPTDTTNPTETTPSTETPSGTEPTEIPTTPPAVPPTTIPETTQPPTVPTEPAPHIHSYESTLTAATCEAGGYTSHTCACGDSYVTDKTNAVGHKFSEWVTVEEATTVAEGKAERKCSACSKTETKKLDKLPVFHSHSYTSKVVAPTCTSEGYTVHTCSCGDSYTDSQTAKTAHNYKSNVTAPTCTTEGYTTYTCSCGHSYIGDKTQKAAHSYKDNVTAPTCNKEGYTTHKCTKCGGSYVDAKVSALGHNYKDTVVAPTCDKGGYTTHKCGRCGYSYNDTYTNATGHDYYVTSDTATCTASGTKTETCGNCGNKKTSTSNAKGHGATRIETTGASCVGTGVEKTICTVCNTVLSQKTVQGNGQHSWTYKNLAEHVKEEMNKGNLRNAKYQNHSDHCVAVCSACGTANYDDIVERYSDYEAAAIMLSYVNNLRESVLGTDEYNFVLDSGLVAKANVRAKEISVHYAHTSGNENITGQGATIYAHYKSWYNSSAHYNVMVGCPIDASGYNGYTRFGYGMYMSPSGTTVYGVQCFGR